MSHPRTPPEAQQQGSKMHPLYFIEIAGLKIRGKWFLEADRDDSRVNVLDTIRAYGDRVLKVLEVNEADGTCRDVTEQMVAEACALEAA